MFIKLKVFAIVFTLSAVAFAACGGFTPTPVVLVVTAPPIVITATELPPSPIPPTPIVIVVTATEPPSTPTPPTDNLDEHAENWDVYTEGTPTYVIQNVNTPSLDGKSLQCSITGGDPFSNVHCYRNLPPEPNTNVFSLTLSFWFTPETTCNNQGTPSIVQAIEFTMSKWDKGQRYEFALQWQNIGGGAPQWRYWDPNRPKGEQWVALNSKITQCLQGDRWHTFTLRGKIINGQVYYQSFTINDQTYSLGLTVSPISTPGEMDRLAVAVQLDGNSKQTPYDVFIDKVNFVREFVTPEPSSPTAAFTPTSKPSPTRTPTLSPPPPPVDCSSAKIDQLPVDSNGQVDKAIKVSWTPSTCRMSVQFYQGGKLLRENKSGDVSGTVDMSNIPSGPTEIKIWVPGSSFPSDSIWIQVK